MHIAICDDNKEEIRRLSTLLDSYRKKQKTSLTYKTFGSGIELLEAMTNERFDLLLLDIIMPGINGVEVAREIRENGDDIKLVFLTSSPEFAIAGYDVDAYRYLLKPATEDSVFQLLDKLSTKANESGIHIKTQSGFLKLNFSKIVFVEVFSKKVKFHLNDGSIKQVYGTLSDYEDTLLAHENFIKPHRSYIVNLSYVEELSNKSLYTIIGESIPISRLSYGQVKDAYTLYLFSEVEDK